MRRVCAGAFAAFRDEGHFFWRWSEAIGRARDDLRRVGVIDEHQLVAEHSVIMDPAYVHITRASQAEHKRLARILQANGVYSVGR